MDVVSAPLAVTLAVLGALTLGAAAVVGARQPLSRERRHRTGMLAGLVPWAGSVLVVVLLVRGAIAGAVFVGVATLLHAAVTRYRAVRPPG